MIGSNNADIAATRYDVRGWLPLPTSASKHVHYVSRVDVRFAPRLCGNAFHAGLVTRQGILEIRC
jgi:hypothetical protein